MKPSSDDPLRADPALRVHRADRPRAALVLAHGVMSHAGWLVPLCEALAARGITAVAVDRPGSGRARDQAGALDPEAWIGALTRVGARLRDEGLPVSLLGWCWGARTALLAAERLDAAHLVLAAPGLAVHASVRARANELEASGADPVGLPFEIEAFSDDAAIVDGIRRDPLAWSSQPRGFLAPSRACLQKALAHLPALRIPRTVILAERDLIVDNDAVTRLLHGQSIAHLPGGHALVLESPALVAEHIARALLS